MTLRPDQTETVRPDARTDARTNTEPEKRARQKINTQHNFFYTHS